MTGQQQQKPCYRCGRTNHDATKCRFIDATCNHCDKKGHISPACRSKQLNRKQPIAKHQTQTKYVANNSEDEEFYLNKVGSQSVKPILVQLEIGGVNLDMELDTGAAYTIISERTRKSFFSKLKVRPSSIRLKTYTDEAINVLGQLHVHVKYNDQQSPLVLLVVEGDGPPLLGRNWLRYIRLDWKRIHAVSTSTTPEMLMSKYADLFKDELGTVSQFQATLHVKDGARPRFFKPRPVPFAIKAAIEKELNEFESSGVITKVAHSEWAAPIVPVPKKNGRFRICGDYKVTINQELEVDQYPLPKPEDLIYLQP